METNQLRDRLVKELSAYYDKVGVNPHHFHCPNKDNCPGENLARGMECHIGRKYGMKKRILFLLWIVGIVDILQLMNVPNMWNINIMILFT